MVLVDDDVERATEQTLLVQHLAEVDDDDILHIHQHRELDE